MVTQTRQNLHTPHLAVKAAIYLFMVPFLAGALFLDDVCQPAQARKIRERGKKRRKAENNKEETKVVLRTIQFPDKYSVGKLFKIETSALGIYSRGAALGEAKGKVSVKAEDKVLLDVEYEGFKNLKFLQGLKADDLYGLSLANDGRGFPVDDGELVLIKHLSGLRVLELEDNDITDDGVNNLSSFGNLEVLNLGHTMISSASLPVIARLTKLTQLELDGISLGENAIKDLSKLTGLKALYMRSCNLKSTSTKHLAAMKSLAVLRLAGNKIGDEGVKNMPVLAELKELNLNETGVTDQSLEKIASYQSLAILTLRGNSFSFSSASSIKSLSRHKKLFYLDISGPKLTDDKIAFGKEMPALKTLRLSAEPSSRAAISRALPGVKLVFDEPKLPLDLFDPLKGR